MTPGPAAMIATVRERWQRFSRLQRIALVGGVVMLIALMIVFTTWSQQTTYGVLFSNLHTQDAAAIITKLKASKIPYQLADNGNAIMVPTGMVAETRLMLAGAGLPNQGVVGFEIFDKSNPLTMTDFTQQLDYQRGLEGELTRTIEQLNGVTGAWVHIVLPQSSLYTSTQQSPTASIVVALAPGMQLDPGQVKAVMHLVASAVQGLKPENVTVVDTNGVNLSDQVQAGTLANGVTAATLGSALTRTRPPNCCAFASSCWLPTPLSISPPSPPEVLDLPPPLLALLPDLADGRVLIRVRQRGAVSQRYPRPNALTAKYPLGISHRV